MAKSKKSRRVRRQEADKQRRDFRKTVETPDVELSEKRILEPEVIEPAPPEVRRKVVDFAQEYAYVYSDLRNIFIITAVLFIVMVGLLYVI